MKSLNQYFDHTLLKPDATEDDIDRLCQEAIANEFYAVCVNSCYVETAADRLAGTGVKIAAVVGFPLGACTAPTKVFETEEACCAGASEVDMVLNVGRFRSGDLSYCQKEIESVVHAAAEYNAIVKVILETCLLSDQEIVRASEMARTAGAQFVKTSTGFSTGGAQETHVRLMKETVGADCQVKASGGIRDLATAQAMIAAGATRIGASASVAILEEAKAAGITQL